MGWCYIGLGVMVAIALNVFLVQKIVKTELSKIRMPFPPMLAEIEAGSKTFGLFALGEKGELKFIKSEVVNFNKNVQKPQPKPQVQPVVEDVGTDTGTSVEVQK